MAGLIAWLMGHQTVLATFGVALLDFLFAMNKNTESNGVLHWIYSFLKGKAKSE